MARLLLLLVVLGLAAVLGGPAGIPPAPTVSHSALLEAVPASSPPGQANGTGSGGPLAVASTLVLMNNTLVPDNFLATNGGAPLVGCVDPVRHMVYAVSFGSLSVINESTSRVAGGVYVGTNNRGIDCNPAGNEVFLADASANLLYVVDTSTLTVVRSVAVGQQPQAVAYDSGRGEIYVGNSLSNDVTVLSGASHAVLATIYVGSPVWGLVYDSGKGEIFASLGPGNNVTVISDSSHALVASVNVGYFPQGLAYNAAAGEVYVANEQSNNVSVISDATNQVIAGIPAGTGPVSAAYDGASGTLFVANSYSGDVSVIDAASRSLLSTIPVGGGAGQGPYGVQVDSGAGLAFVDSTAMSTVIAINVTSQSIAAQIPTGTTPYAVACDPGRGELFVSSGFLSGVLYILSDTTNRIIATIPLGVAPRQLAIDPIHGLVFAPVLTQGANTMFVISSVTNAVTATFNFTVFPSAVAVDPDRGLLFLATTGAPPAFPAEVIVYNETSFAEVAHITAGTSPQTLAYDSGTGQMFVGSEDASGSGVVYVIDDSSLRVVATVTVAPGPYPWLTSLAYDPELGEILVADSRANAIHVISDVSATVVANVTGLPGPQALAYVGSGLVIVTGNGTTNVTPFTPGFVSVVSDATNSVLATVSVGASPAAAVYDPRVAAVYVSNMGQGTISVIPISRPYVVSFTQSGLAGGTPWSVVLEGRTAWTAKPQIAFLEPNGTYAYQVAPKSGYTATPATGSANVTGAEVSVNVIFRESSIPPPPPSSGPPTVFPWLFVIAVGVAAALLVAVGAASALDESARFLVLAAVAFPFFTLRKEEALDHFVRGQIYEYLRHHPGATYTEIKDHLALKNGTAAHHLMVLEKMGFLTSRREGRTKRFVRVDARVASIPAGLSPLQYNILSLLAQEPLSQTDLARRLAFSKQRVSYNVRRLRRDGYLDLAEQGRVLHVTAKGNTTLAQQDTAAGEL